MARKPFFDMLAHEASGSFATLFAIALGALAVYFAYCRKQHPRRRPATRAIRHNVTPEQRNSVAPDQLSDPLSRLRHQQFIGSKICIEWDLLHDGSAWRAKGKARDVLVWLAFTADVYLLCRIDTEEDKAHILREVRMIDGLQRHKILFCRTPAGYEAMTRQICRNHCEEAQIHAPYKEAKKYSMPDERILLITGIPSKTFKGEYLYKLFGEYGGIQQIRIGNSPITKGCAIVVYEQTEAANAAVAALNNFLIGKDRILRVSVYDEDRDKRALQRRKRKREMQADYVKHVVRTGIEANELEQG